MNSRLETVTALGVVGVVGMLVIVLLNTFEVTTLPEKKEFLPYDVIYASDNETGYSSREVASEETLEDSQLEQITTTVHDTDTPISADSLELIISNSTVTRNTNFFITVGVMAHRTGNVDTLWNLELVAPPSYEITDTNDTSGYQNTTTRAHGKSKVTWEVVSPPIPSEHPDIFKVTAMAYDADTGALLNDSPISKDYEITTANMNPVATNDSFSTNEDTSVALSMLQNDIDADGDALIISEISNGPYDGIIIMNDNSTLPMYSPNNNFFGNDAFVYLISDEYNGISSASVTIRIVPVNDPPVALNDYVITQEDIPVDIDVLENDYDPDYSMNGSDIHEPIEIVMVSSPLNGTAVLYSNHDANRSSTVITYIPSGNFSGNDTFDYVISDGSVDSTGEVTVVIEQVNDRPGASSANFTTIENQSVGIVLRGCDPDGDQLDFEVLNNPSNGSLGPISVSGLATAHVTYSPNRNYHGTDSFTFITSDGTLASAVATISILITHSTEGSEDTDDNDQSHASAGRSNHNGKNKEAESQTHNVEDSGDGYEKLVVTSYKMFDKDGKVITCVNQGTEATFSYAVTNSGLTDYDCILIWELIDENGVTRNIQMYRMTLPRIDSITYDIIKWSGDELGRYEVRLFLWTDLVNPIPLSKSFMHDFAVKH